MISRVRSQPTVVSQVERIARLMGRTSTISFWIQIFLGVIGSILLLLTTPMLFARTSPTPGAVPVGPGPGSIGGLAVAVVAMLTLLASIYYTFTNTQHARRLQAPKNARPSKADTLKRLRLGVLINLFGLGLALVGAEAVTGQLTNKLLMQSSPFNLGFVDPSRFIQALDVFVVLGNTHGMFAHFCNLTANLWLIDRISKAGSSGD